MVLRHVPSRVHSNCGSSELSEASCVQLRGLTVHQAGTRRGEGGGWGGGGKKSLLGIAFDKQGMAFPDALEKSLPSSLNCTVWPLLTHH